MVITKISLEKKAKIKKKPSKKKIVCFVYFLYTRKAQLSRY